MKTIINGRDSIVIPICWSEDDNGKRTYDIDEMTRMFEEELKELIK